MFSTMRVGSLVVCSALFFSLLPGCASTDHQGKAVGVLGGAALGAAIAAAAGLDPAAGAAIGAGAGLVAGLAYDYHVQQTKKAPEVERDFKKQHDGQLPIETMVSKYSTRIGPSDSVKRGQDLTFYSDIELVKGRNQQMKKDLLQEELVIYNDMADLPPRKQKKDVQSDPYNSGAYQSTLKFKVDDALEDGAYRFKKALYLNENLVRETSGNFKVVKVNDQYKIAFIP